MSEVTLLSNGDNLLRLRLSYAVRRLINHRSVRKFENFAAFHTSLYEEPNVKDQHQQVIRFAKACIESGDLERLLKESANFSPAAWMLPQLRMNVFVALVALGRFREARDLLSDTLSMGVFTPVSLTRMLGDAYLLEDDLLLEQCAKALLTAASKLTSQQQIYVLETVRLSLGRDALLRVGHLTTQSACPDLNFFLSNQGFAQGDYAAQLEEVNKALTMYGLENVSAIDPTQPLSVTNMRSHANSATCSSGPLVSILMSTFNASDTLIPALESLSAQSYQNIEILVVNDCSDDQTVELAQRYAADVDPRVRVFRMDKNGGTYRARNRGLVEARGEFFTCNDSDDWAHPRKIELLVSPLLNNQGLLGTHSQLIRIGKELGIKPRQRGYLQDDMSSLCYRRQIVMDRLGYYEAVSFGADSEFTQRMKTFFGEAAIEVIRRPLLMANWSERSLTGSLETGITRGGTMAKKRLEYRAEFRKRHKAGQLRLERAV